MSGSVLVFALCGSPAFAGPLFTDPVGDTFGAGPFRPDVTTYSAIATPSPVPNVTFTVNFAGPISPPSANAPSTSPAPSVVGFIDLDTDRNPLTGGSAPWPRPVSGGNSWINSFIASGAAPGPAIALGDEFYVDVGSELVHAGLVNIVRTSDNAVVDTVPILFAPTGFSLSVPLSDLQSNGDLNFGLIVGNFASPTDRAPNGALPAESTVESTVVPEPGGLLLFGTGLLGLLGRGLGRRRAARRAGEWGVPWDCCHA